MDQYCQQLRIPLQTVKTQCLGVGRFRDLRLPLADAQIGAASQLRVLGQDLAAYLTRKGTAMYQERVQKFRQRIQSIKRLGLPMQIRQRLLKTMAYPVLNFCPWQAPPMSASNLRGQVVSLLMPQLPRHRAAEVVTTVLNPSHVTDPMCVMAYRLLCHVGAHLRSCPQDRERFPTQPILVGPFGVLVDLLNAIGLEVQSGAQVEVPGVGTISCTMPPVGRLEKTWRHNWREILRRAVYRNLAARRPSFSGIEGGIDKKLSSLLYGLLCDPRQQLHVAITLTVSQVTGASAHMMGQAQDDSCPHCDHPSEDQYHFFWQCPYWQEIRDLWFPEVPYAYPRVTPCHGLVPLGAPITKQQVLKVQAFQLHLSLLRRRLEVGPIPGETIPGLEMLEVWHTKRAFTNLVCEPNLELNGERDIRWELEEQQQWVGNHRLSRASASVLACDFCGSRYALGSSYRFAYCECNQDMPQMPTSSLPAAPQRIQDLWPLPRHDGLRHDFEVVGRVILCKVCGARWKWSQRFRLPSIRCPGSRQMEQLRRQVLDESLPLVRNGHVPKIHAEFSALQCQVCNWETQGENVRAFDRHVCVGALGHIRGLVALRERRQRRFFPLGRGARWQAKCLHCEYAVPWHLRSASFRTHACKRR